MLADRIADLPAAHHRLAMLPGLLVHADVHSRMPTPERCERVHTRFSRDSPLNGLFARPRG